MQKRIVSSGLLMDEIFYFCFNNIGSSNKGLLAGAARSCSCIASGVFIRAEYMARHRVVGVPGETRGNGHTTVSERTNPNDISIICSKVAGFLPGNIRCWHTRRDNLILKQQKGPDK